MSGIRGWSGFTYQFVMCWFVISLIQCSLFFELTMHMSFICILHYTHIGDPVYQQTEPTNPSTVILHPV